jgi:RNA polymerase sigma factor (sigma-70 family)
MFPQEAPTSRTVASDDLGLAKAIAAGDQGAFELLMRRYNRRLFRLARAVLANEAEAEDALQDAYLHAYRAIGEFRGEAGLSTWLSRLVLNECLSRKRRTLRRENVIPIVSAEANMNVVAETADEGARTEDAAAALQMRDVLERKVNELPEQFRVVFVLRSVEEMEVDEIASLLGVPAETVRSRHFRARGLLRESLACDFDLAERDLFEFGGRRCDRIVARVLSRL